MMHRNKIAWLKLVDLSGFVRRIVDKMWSISYFFGLFLISSRGLGSGMDSRSESDGQESSDDNTLSIPHVTGDGSNGRPGLEGANSDTEDLPAVNGLPLDTSNRLETQGLGKFSCMVSMYKNPTHLGKTSYNTAITIPFEFSVIL